LSGRLNLTSRWSLATVLVGTVLVVGVLAPAASAHSITGLQWTSVDSLCTSNTCVIQGNLVGAWQSILFADGYLTLCGGSGIDGHFGPLTKAATQSWQGAHGLAADGIVGPKTWGKARGVLAFKSIVFSLPISVQYWDYVGSKHTIHFKYSSSTWSFRSPANQAQLPYYATSHPDIFFYTC
jgi:Putative peptidoglycan binding domain